MVHFHGKMKARNNAKITKTQTIFLKSWNKVGWKYMHKLRWTIYFIINSFLTLLHNETLRDYFVAH